MARRGRAKHAIAPSLDNDPSDRKVFAKDGGHVHDPVIFVFARPETPHHRYESSLSDVSVCLSICFRSCESWLASEGGDVSIRNSRLLDPIHVQAQRTQSWPPHPPLESYRRYLYEWIGILGAIGSV